MQIIIGLIALCAVGMLLYDLYVLMKGEEER